MVSCCNLWSVLCFVYSCETTQHCLYPRVDVNKRVVRVLSQKLVRHIRQYQIPVCELLLSSQGYGRFVACETFISLTKISTQANSRSRCAEVRLCFICVLFEKPMSA